MSTTRPSAPTPASDVPAPSTSNRTLAPSAKLRTDRMTTAALTVFVGIYSTFFFPFRFSNFMPSKAALEVTIALYVVLFAVGCVAFRHPLAHAFKQIAAHKRRAVLTLIAGGIASLAIELVGSLTSSALLDFTGLSGATLQNDSNIGSVIRMFPPIVIVIVLGVLGPAVEEMVFRRLLIGLIGRIAPTWVAVVVSSILFGALHMSSFTLSEVLGVLPQAFFGLGLGLLYVRTDRNLLYPASIHCLNNLSAFLTLLLH